MKNAIHVGLLLLSLIASTATAQSGPQFGSYVGTMQHAKIAKDQFAKLDFIFSRDGGSQFELKAVLSLYFGDFSSQEYVSYHFDKVIYNLVTGTLVFDQSDQDITIVTESFANGQLIAKVRSATAGDVGTITLQNNGVASTERGPILTVAGKYQGFCDGRSTDLQLMSYKSTQDTLRLGNPFGSYNLIGQVGDRETFTCPSDDDKACITDIVIGGSYDFYQGQMTLFGKRITYNCNVEGNVLDCGSCQFTKEPAPADAGLVTKPLITESPWKNPEPSSPSTPPAPSSVGGHYKGYLHHERLDQYQAASLNIVTYQDYDEEGAQTLQMSAAATLFFGDQGSPEALPYRFAKRTYNILSPVFVFEGMASDVDAILQVTQMGAGSVQGVWYSLLYGRVGTFNLVKEGTPNLPSGAKVFRPISGDYESPTFKLRVSTRLDATPVNTENPFYPQVFGGYFWYKSGIAPRIAIVDGSYDFYTGKLALIVEDEHRIAVGETDPHTSMMKLLWPPKIITPPMPDYELETFTK